MGYPIKGSLRQAVLAAVLGGASTTDEVVALVGHKVTPASAQRSGLQEWRASVKAHYPNTKLPSQAKLIRRGRKKTVTSVLVRLVKDGLLRRVAAGVYGPPQPKLFQPETQAS